MSVAGLSVNRVRQHDITKSLDAWATEIKMRKRSVLSDADKQRMMAIAESLPRPAIPSDETMEQMLDALQDQRSRPLTILTRSYERRMSNPAIFVFGLWLVVAVVALVVRMYETR